MNGTLAWVWRPLRCFPCPSAWEVAARHRPAVLLGAPSRVVVGRTVPLLWPVLTGCVLTALAVGAAVGVFSRREL